MNWHTLKEKMHGDILIINSIKKNRISTFSELLDDTGISRSRLANHLNGLKYDKILLGKNGTYVLNEKYNNIIHYRAKMRREYDKEYSKLLKHTRKK